MPTLQHQFSNLNPLPISLPRFHMQICNTSRKAAYPDSNPRMRDAHGCIRTLGTAHNDKNRKGDAVGRALSLSPAFLPHSFFLLAKKAPSTIASPSFLRFSSNLSSFSSDSRLFHHTKVRFFFFWFPFIIHFSET